jgi:hypothetical protein
MPAWSERIEEGEQARFDALAARLRAVQEARAQQRPMGKGLHYKPVAAARAELTVHDGLPEALRVGIFAAPGTFPAVVRFSNGSGKNQPDAEPDVRGMAVKVVGVPGPKLIPPLRDAVTQDFLAITSEMTPFLTAEEFVTVIEASSGSKLGALFALVWALGPARAFALLGQLQKDLGTPLAHYAEKPFFSALPIRWGDLAVKYSFDPIAVYAEGTPDRSARDHYGPDLQRRLAAAPIRFAVRVQRFVDEATTPIEDPLVRWTSPWEVVATLELPRQDLAAPAAVALSARAEGWSFDPWHAPEAFRPLGAVMRARSAAYREAVIARKASPEPTPEDLTTPA